MQGGRGEIKSSHCEPVMEREREGEKGRGVIKEGGREVERERGGVIGCSLTNGMPRETISRANTFLSGLSQSLCYRSSFPNN